MGPPGSVWTDVENLAPYRDTIFVPFNPLPVAVPTELSRRMRNVHTQVRLKIKISKMGNW
jgi:hypothetical protein